MSTGQFHIVFDGPAFETHEMNVRDLAPALLAISDIFDEINHVAFSNRYKVAVNVKASFQTGSFLTELAVHANNILELFKNNDTVNAIASMMQLFGLPGVIPVAWGVIALIRWVRRRKISRVIELEGGKVRLEIDGESIEVEQIVLALYQSLKLRKAFEDLIAKPLEKEGIESIGFGNYKTKQFVSIPKDEAIWFFADEPEDEPMGASTRRGHLQIISPCFQEGNKWRFSDGSVSFHAEIRDTSFLQKVMEGDELFAKGDILDVEMTEEQTLTATGLKTERFIERVFGHRNPTRQYRLPSVDK